MSPDETDGTGTEQRESAVVLRDYQEAARQHVLGAIARGEQRMYFTCPTGCHRVGQGILMFDGSIKAVEDVAVGDQLMGPDSTPRTVLALARSREEMYEVQPVKGLPWVVNKSHILTLVRTNVRNGKRGRSPSNRGGVVKDVRVSDWLLWSAYEKHIHKLFRVGVDFHQTPELPLHPYLLGVLLGDGGMATPGRVTITKPDTELIGEARRILESSGLRLDFIGLSGGGCPDYAVRGPSDMKAERFLTPLRNLGLYPVKCEAKHIPACYKTASRTDRLQLLAGLLDTDGHHTCGGYDYISKSRQLADDILFLARSLGLAAYNGAHKIIKGVTYYRLSISGDCSIIPTRIPRKQAPVRTRKKDVLRTGFACVPTGTTEDYYGFSLTGDGRYLLGDFTVTHNTGKAVIISSLAYDLSERGRVILIAHREELVTQLAAQCERWLPGQVGIVMANRDECGMPVVVASVQSLHAKRLQRLLAASREPIAALIIDEAHHATPRNTYHTLIQRINEHSPKVAVVGCTATPYRSDADVMQHVLPACVFERDIASMQEAGWLAPLVWRQVRVPMHLADILFAKAASNGGERDYDESELALDALRPEVLTALVEGTRHYIALTKRPTVAFAVNVAHAQALAEAYREVGITAAAVWGDMPKDARRRTLAAWKSGEIQLVSNVGILTEGFDYPGLACIVMARPTASLVLYTQILGRGLRLAPGKRNCLILEATAGQPDPRQVTAGDVVPVVEADAEDIFGPRGGGWDGEREDDKDEDGEEGMMPTEHKPRVATLTLLDPRHDATYRWSYYPQWGAYTITVDQWHTLFVMRDPDAAGSGLYRACVRSPREVEMLTPTRRTFPLRAAQKQARKWLDKHAVLKFAGKAQEWHGVGITAKQREFLAKHAPDRMQPGMTAGQASDVIGEVVIGWNIPQVREALWGVSEAATSETAVM